MKVLNVGGGASRVLPEQYAGWEQHLLDIDPNVNPDVCCDAKLMINLEAGEYDAVYCSHNLEHFYRHDVPTVLGGFAHVLKPGGFVDIHVPNIMQVLRDLLDRGLDLSDVYYRTTEGNAIHFHDVLYGWNAAMANGNEFYSHKCGFSGLMLHAALVAAGFQKCSVAAVGSNLHAVGYKGAV